MDIWVRRNLWGFHTVDIFEGTLVSSRRWEVPVKGYMGWGCESAYVP